MTNVRQRPPVARRASGQELDPHIRPVGRVPSTAPELPVVRLAAAGATNPTSPRTRC
ncbi:hypothetical protein QEZ54_07195 [Catellatospora sp. KI3]|uniref:hypothetical protein n=1 Tax=Catellatospora sp. KI3 TaxID=3041620 RepID=UPI002482399E|nr:hypothetical protein [Catellatospora sp. KI3]MDI1460746.1 hypothetical protein [Catellatospora sp. KI3]